MPNPQADGVSIQAFDARYASQVADLFKTVYGDDYPITTYYDPIGLEKAIAKGELFQSLAITRDGLVVGVGNMYRSAPYSGIYEVGAGLVHPDYRRLNLFTRLYEYLCEVIAPGAGIPLLYGEDVCNHLYTQKMQASLGFSPIALEVDLMPAQTYAKEKSASGRVASLLDCRVFSSNPHRIYAPPSYEAELNYIYSGLDDARTIENSIQAPPAESASRITSQYFEHAGVSRITVDSIGHDFEDALDRVEREAQGNHSVVWQVWLRLDCPWVASAVEVLRGRGYFLGGLLPRWFDGDGLLMQKVNAEPNWEGINLLQDRAKRILELVKADWETSLSD
jgi:hypothetical protein